MRLSAMILLTCVALGLLALGGISAAKTLATTDDPPARGHDLPAVRICVTAPAGEAGCAPPPRVEVRPFDRADGALRIT